MVNAKIRTAGDTTRKEVQKLILIVDDEVDIASTFSMLFELQGYKTMTASNGRQALDMLASTVPDLILSDLMMPVMDGIELSRQVRNNEASKHVPFILMSAVPPLQKPSGAGYDVFLQKPVQFKDVFAAIERLPGNEL